MSWDLLIKNAQVVTDTSVERLDVAIENEKIVELAAEIQGSAKQTINAENLHLFPGVIDSHVHLNDAGATDPKDRADWEGVPTGSAALAAGGGTCFFDMPLNSVPPTLDAASFDAKLNRCRAASHTDFAFWGGLTPKNLDHLETLADRGVVGFKAFMTNSGIPDFLACDDDSLLAGIRIAAKLNLPVALHAEDEALTARLTAEARSTGKTDIRAYLDSRPVEAEVLAIRKAIKMSRQTGCSIHIVHVSSSEGLAEILTATAELFSAELKGRPLGRVLIKMGLLTREQVHSALARQAELRTKGINTPVGEILVDMRLITTQQRDEALAFQIGNISQTQLSAANVTAETCPHYLLLNDTGVERLGAAAKCSPPIRDEINRESLVTHLCKGHFTSVGSDHSPAPATLKTSADFFNIWGGISSIQLTLRLLLSLQLQTHELDLATISRVLSANPATRFRLAGKGRIAQGYDADLSLVDLRHSAPLTQSVLLDRHKLSPYLGQTLRGQIRQTILRGRTIFQDGKITAPPAGQFLRPSQI